MGARSTYALACDGHTCKEVYFPTPRVEVHILTKDGRAVVMTVPQRATLVRQEAERAGWSHAFHQHRGGLGWYEDHCPACTKGRTGA